MMTDTSLLLTYMSADSVVLLTNTCVARDSDGSSEAGETGTGSTVGDSAGRETASPNADRTPA